MSSSRPTVGPAAPIRPTAVRAAVAVASGPLEMDPLFRRQRAEARPYGPDDYRRAVVEACELYVGPQLRMGRKSVFEGGRDLIEAVLTGYGERKLGMGDTAAELRVLEGVVGQARNFGRPLSLGEVIAVALTETTGDLGEAMDLAAAAMQKVVRDTAYYRDYAAKHGIALDRIGLHETGASSPYAVGVGFMARYVRDPNGQAYGLAGGESEAAYATAHNLTGQIYHALDVMRLTAMNDLLTPETSGRLIALYYSEAMEKVRLRGVQGPEKAAQDAAAVAGMRALVHGSAPEEARVRALLMQNQRGKFYKGLSSGLMGLAEGTIRRLADWGFKLPKTRFI